MACGRCAEIRAELRAAIQRGNLTDASSTASSGLVEMLRQIRAAAGGKAPPVVTQGRRK